MFTESVSILAVLCGLVALSEWLATRKYFNQLGTALLVIVLTALVANVGIIPSSSGHTELYEGIFTYVAPISIFMLMLSVNLRSIKKAGPRMIGLFLVGAVGTALGIGMSMKLLDSAQALGESHFAIGGMLTGTYTGGSLNFNAVALHYNITREGSLYAATTAADNIVTALWIVATLAMPTLLRRVFGEMRTQASPPLSDVQEGVFEDEERLRPVDVGLLAVLALGALGVVNWLHSLLPAIPSVLILTTLALILAQWPVVARLRGSKVVGLFLIYLFLAVIGAYCDIPALLADGTQALWLLLAISLGILIHALILVGVARLTRQDWDMVAIVSQANVGGSSSALALARSLGRPDLQLPAILIGTLGNAIGTYLGFMVAELLR